MTSDLDEAMRFGETIVVGHNDPTFADSVSKLSGGKTVIDLVRLFDTPPDGIDYHGFNW